MRGWGIGLWLGLTLAAMTGAETSQACLGCAPSMYCVSTREGGLMCLGDGNACLMAGKCKGPLMMPDFARIGVTLLEDVAGAGPGIARTAQSFGEPGVGRSAARIAARALGAPGAEPEQLYSATGRFAGGTALFRTPTGDGFALGLEREGDRARVTVSAVAAGRAGRVLAFERLGADEALVVRVPFEGRTRVLVLTAAVGAEAESPTREEAVRRELESGAFPLRPDPRPPFELRVLER